MGEALLAPTTLYSPVTEALWKEGIAPHYCANITGHGWRKLKNQLYYFRRQANFLEEQLTGETAE